LPYLTLPYLQLAQRLLHSHLNPLLALPFGWLALLPVLLLTDPVLKLAARIKYERERERERERGRGRGRERGRERD